MDKKYFFFDIDGTLTDDATHRIVPSAQKALQQLQENGHFVAIATGRIHYKAKAFTDSIDIHNVVCSGGGCLVLNDKVVKDEPLPLEKVITLLDRASANGIGFSMILDDSDKLYLTNTDFILQAGRRRELTTYILDPKLDYHSLPAIYKVYLAIPQGQEEQYPWINEVGHLRMTKDYLVFQYDEKRQGILDMMAYLKADPKDVVVFGDAKNDLIMFDPQWFSIAMGNGCQELKDKANYITDTNVNDGIYKACKAFGWI